MPPLAHSAMSKAMWRIVPLILCAYVMAYIDRINVSFASLQMNQDLRFSASVYGLGSGLFFLSYAIFEVPSSLMLRRFTAPQWIARIMITWGLLSAAMMFVTTPLQFYVMRFLLGVAEAGFFPCVIFYFSAWFPVAWRGRAISRMYIGSSLASFFMGAISSTLLGLDGLAGLRGWQWLFLVQGLPAIPFGLLLLRFLPATPAVAPWLTPAEKDWLQQQHARDHALLGPPGGHNFLAAFVHPKVLLFGCVGLLGNGAIGGLILSAPAILVAQSGISSTQSGFLVSLGGVLSVACVLFVGWHSDRTGDRLFDSLLCCLATAAGILLLALATVSTLVIPAYLLFATVAFAGGVLVIVSIPDVLHPRELAVGTAAINTLWQVGSFLSPWFFGLARDATGAYRAGLLACALVGLVQCGLIFYARHQLLTERRLRTLALTPQPAA